MSSCLLSLYVPTIERERRWFWVLDPGSEKLQQLLSSRSVVVVVTRHADVTAAAAAGRAALFFSSPDNEKFFSSYLHYPQFLHFLSRNLKFCRVDDF